MPQRIAEIIKLCEELNCAYLENEPMSGRTTLHIGGPADLMILPDREEQLARLLPAVREWGLPLYLIGRGSNLLVADDGLRGVVVCLGKAFSKIERIGEDTIRCAAGASLDSVCRFALQHSLGGLEFAYGIPGSLGGAVMMNAGAYGGEMKDVLVSSRHLEPWGEIGALMGGALGFSYRRSAYTGTSRCILGAEIQLHPDDPARIRERMEELKSRRREKQPLEFPSAGSTFKRPQGNYASALIDQCGLKGRSVGGAQVSEKHAGFLINRGGATCWDMLALITLVQRTVFEMTGYRLECEVRLLGLPGVPGIP